MAINIIYAPFSLEFSSFTLVVLRCQVHLQIQLRSLIGSHFDYFKALGPS